MTYESVLARFFPAISTEAGFVDETFASLRGLGFAADNTIAIVCVCRDEISQTIMPLVKARWGEAFNLCSLAGMFFAGRTALHAAMHHAPRQDGRERHAFFILPHVAIDGEGHVGVCERPGVGQSNACGALNAFLKELRGGKLDVSLDEHDLEQSLLKMRLIREIPYGQIPDLLALTRIVHRVALADLEHALQSVIDPSVCDHAVISGIQVHGPDGNHIVPSPCYAMVEGARREIVVPAARLG